MGCVARIFGVLVGIVIILTGLVMADYGDFGGGNPKVGIPIVLIGAGLFLFVVVVSILRTGWPTAMETFVITIGVISLAIGVERINVEVTARALSAWPIVICGTGALVILFHRRIAGWARSAAGFIRPRSSGK